MFPLFEKLPWILFTWAFLLLWWSFEGTWSWWLLFSIWNSRIWRIWEVIIGQNFSYTDKLLYVCKYAFIYFRKTIFLRYFVATRDIQPLELVVVDEAAVIGPSTKTKPLCLECLKPPTQVLPGKSLDQIDQLHYCKGCGFLMCAKCDQIENKKLHLRQECDILAGSGLNKEVCFWISKKMLHIVK